MSAISIQELTPKPKKRIVLKRNTLLTAGTIRATNYGEKSFFLKIPKNILRELGVRSHGTSHNWELKITLERKEQINIRGNEK